MVRCSFSNAFVIFASIFSDQMPIDQRFDKPSMRILYLEYLKRKESAENVRLHRLTNYLYDFLREVKDWAMRPIVLLILIRSVTFRIQMFWADINYGKIVLRISDN
jgi:hypothetical protein